MGYSRRFSGGPPQPPASSRRISGQFDEGRKRAATGRRIADIQVLPVAAEDRVFLLAAYLLSEFGEEVLDIALRTVARDRRPPQGPP